MAPRSPRGIAVHPGIGKVFWSDWDRLDCHHDHQNPHYHNHWELGIYVSQCPMIFFFSLPPGIITIIIMIISYALFAARDHPKIEMANADGSERQVSQKLIL